MRLIRAALPGPIRLALPEDDDAGRPILTPIFDAAEVRAGHDGFAAIVAGVPDRFMDARREDSWSQRAHPSTRRIVDADPDLSLRPLTWDLEDDRCRFAQGVRNAGTDAQSASRGRPFLGRSRETANRKRSDESAGDPVGAWRIVANRQVTMFRIAEERVAGDVAVDPEVIGQDPGPITARIAEDVGARDRDEARLDSRAPAIERNDRVRNGDLVAAQAEDPTAVLTAVSVERALNQCTAVRSESNSAALGGPVVPDEDAVIEDCGMAGRTDGCRSAGPVWR